VSFPRYPKYKSSGAAWLGSIPEHWDVGQSRRLFALRNQRAVDTDEQLTASQEHGIVRQKDFIQLEGRRVVEVVKGADILKHVEPNDFVISMRSFEGGIEWSRLRGCISSAYVMLVPSEKLYAPYFAHLLKSAIYIQALQSTTNLVRDGQALRYNNFVQIDLPLLPVAEQMAIAAFLDLEISKIDALVAEQRRLMDVLKEKRQAVISHAVTKGLNPHAPMKDSGIEWLGEVPAHWSVASLRYFATFATGSTPDRSSPRYWNGGIPWVKTGEINYSTITETEETISEEGLASCSVAIAPPGTLLMALYGQGVTRGRVALLGIPATYNQACAAIQLDERIDRHFAVRFFEFAYRFVREIGNETTQMNLNVEFVRGIRVVIPPLDEQRTIAILLDRKTLEMDSLVLEGQRAIDLLLERRAALISAAVTGQIDVRRVVAAGADACA
jgi:type I restriction enzyme S subunit